MNHNQPVESFPNRTDLPERLALQTVRNPAHARAPDRPVCPVHYGTHESTLTGADF